jgi:TonB family protein
MLSSLLKRALPFVLTLSFGLALGSLFRTPFYSEKVTQSTLVTTAATPRLRSCGSRLRIEREYARSSPVHITYKPTPAYTEDARRDHITGSVELKMVLRKDGTVDEITPIRTLPDGLTEEAVKAAERIEFIPAMVNGEAVDAVQWVEYYFDISGQHAVSY